MSRREVNHPLEVSLRDSCDKKPLKKSLRHSYDRSGSRRILFLVVLTVFHTVSHSHLTARLPRHRGLATVPVTGAISDVQDGGATSGGIRDGLD